MHGPGVRSALADAVAAGVELIRADAQESIRAGAISGPNHVPSAPGEPPNADTHELDNSIKASVDRKKLLGRVTVESEYGAAQEFGTDVLPERPFMRPAAKRQRPAARAKVREANLRIIKGV